MRTAISGSTKWAIAVGALKTMMTKYTAKIRFGITLFPDIDSNQCGQGAIPLEPAVGNETKISTMLTNALKAADPLYPDGPCVTNIDTALLQVTGSTALKDATRGNYV